MLNARTMKDWLIKNVPADASKVIIQHMVAGTTAVEKATAFGISADNCFGFWDWVEHLIAYIFFCEFPSFNYYSKCIVNFICMFG